MVRRPTRLPHVVLVGGGHAHVQVLLRHRERPFAARLTVVVDAPEAVYSGMVPGLVAGQYTAQDLAIDVWALAATADVRVVDGAATRVDAERGCLEVGGRRLRYDTLSIDVGSTVAGLELPGVREHALSTRPIGRFVAQVDARLAALPGALPIVVVGAGAAGFELAYCLEARAGRDVVLLGTRPPVVPAVPGRRVAVRVADVRQVTADGVVLSTGEAIRAALVVWATGAAALPLGAQSGLPCEDGYIRVDPTLQVEGYPGIFAVGDCARVPDGRGGTVPKAGVYAVREGPVLCANLDARLTGTQLTRYAPQRDFLALLNLGDGTAIARRWGAAARGAWAWRLKDRIDRRFMAMFQVIGRDDAVNPVVGAMAVAMADDMVCGGCAAKVGAAELHAALGGLPPAAADPTVVSGMAEADDAAVVTLPSGERLGLSVDAFTAFCDDPFVVGRVAVVNAVNDLYVKGIEPRWAMATVAVPDEDGVLDEVMAGVRSALDELGVTLVGGHTVRAAELSVGLSVTGLAPAWAPAATSAGDALVLTRGLGSGVLLRAGGLGRARGTWLREAVRWMSRSHKAAAAVLREHGAGAATDVTGFGLYGHLATLLERAGGLGADVTVADLPLYPGARSLFLQGVRSTFHAQNVRAVAISGPGASHALAEIGYDPQTAGPVLVALSQARVAAALAALAEAGEPARVIGVLSAEPGIRLT